LDFAKFQLLWLRRLGSASTSVSTACLAADVSSCSLSAVFDQIKFFEPILHH